MKPLLPCLGIIGFAGALAACGGHNNPAPSPTPGPTCSPPGQTVQVYPAPGASGVVDNNGEIVIGSSAALTSSWDIIITDSIFPNGAVIPGGLQTVTPPFPTPNATPSFANPHYQASSFGSPFASNQVVTVFVNDSGSNCSPLQLGSFST